MEITGKKLLQENAELRAKLKKTERELLLCKQPTPKRGEALRTKEALESQISLTKQAERAFRALEYRYHSLFNQMSEGFALCEVVFDEENEPSDLRILEVNPAIEQLSGFKRADLVGKTLREALPKAHLGWIKNCGRVGLDGRPVHFERYSDSYNRHFDVSAYSPASGKVACLFRDITHRKQAESALAEMQERLQLALDSTELGTFDFEPQTGRLVWSKFAWHHFTLHPGETATTETFLRAVHPEDRPRIARRLMEALKPENPGIFTAEYRTIGLTDEKERWISAQGRVFFGEEGQPVRFLGVLLDISKRKKMEQERQELLSEFQRQRSLLAAIITQMPIGVTVAEVPTGRILLTNNASGRIFGSGMDYERGLDCYQQILATDKEGASMSARNWPLIQAIKTGNIVPNEQIQILLPDGTRRVVSSGGTPIVNHKGKVVAAVSLTTDITERVRMQEALRESKELLEQKISERTAELSRTNATLRMISQCDHVLAHASNEAALIKTVCKLIYDMGVYRGVAVGFAEHDENKTIRVVSRVGRKLGTRQPLKLSWEDNEFGQSPAGKAIRSGKVSLAKDYVTDPNLAPWKKYALPVGIVSSIALPLKDRDQVFGVLALYANTLDVFDEHQIALLTELANNLAFGITALRSRRDRDAALKNLKQKTLELQTLAHELTRVAEEERGRMGHLLKEDLQQSLLNARFQLNQIGNSKAADSPLRRQIEQVGAILEHCLLSTHSLTEELIPKVLLEPDFGAALKWLGDQFKKTYGLTVTFIPDDPIPIESEATKLALFHEVRELLFNTVKQAKTRVALRLTQEDGQIRISKGDQSSDFLRANELEIKRCPTNSQT